MSQPFPPGLSHIAAAIADGEPVDWRALESSVSSDDEKSFLARLKTIAEVSQLHSTGLFSNSGLTSISRADLSVRELPIYAAGSSWGHLKILEVVGQGRYGVVYRAWDPKLEREVALKILRHRQVDEASEVVHEARVMARVHHPNVVTVYGADAHDGHTGIWMQFIEGRTLEAELRADGRFAIDNLATVGSQLCAALTAVHRAGLLHRDVKPQNVMRDQHGRVVLGDFGTGRLTEEDLGGLAGTPLYLAPELIDGATASERSDIYSLGVLLFHLGTDTYPVAARSIAELREAHGSTKRQKLSALRPDLAGPVAAAIERAIARPPEERWDSAEAMQAAISHQPRPALAWWRTRTAAVAAMLLILAAIAGSIWIPRSSSGGNSAGLVSVDRPWVLLASSENRTGNPELDGVLEHALERELIGSPQFHVASRPRVEDVLRLMRRPRDSRIDESSAREVAIRDGGIATVIGARLETVGSTTVPSVSIIDVSSGTTLTRLSEEARTPADLPAAIRRLSDRLRAALGETESSIRNSSLRLERVTTPSLKALRLYSEAYAAGSREQWPAALTLSKEAISEDPTFAAAYTWLAWAMFRNQVPSSDYLAAASKAVSLSGNASEWERLWIQASFYGLSNNPNAARAAYEALLKLYPDHLWATNNLVILHRGGREAEAVPLVTRLVALRPRDYNALVLAFDTHRRLGMLDKAAEYANRIKANGVYNRSPSGDPWVFDAVVAWHNGDAKALVTQLRRIQGEASSLEADLRDAVLARVSMLWLAAGRPADAERALQLATASADAHLARAAIAHSLDDPATARREVLAANVLDVPAGGTNVSEVAQRAIAMWLIVRTGNARDVRSSYAERPPVAASGPQPQGPAIANILAAEAAFAQGRTGEVITRLSPQSAWNVLADAINFRAAETLAETLAARDDKAGAAKALEHALASKHFAASDGAYWQLRCQLRLAELYRQLGQREAAATHAASVARWLGEGDPSVPIVARARTVAAVHEVAEIPDSDTGTGTVPPPTTGSIRARRLYLAAADLLQGAPPWPNTEAERLLREAIQFDNSFASAHILLAHVLNNQLRPVADVMAEAGRARDLATSATEVERAFINASFHFLRARSESADAEWRAALEQAASSYERVLALAPNHRWVSANLVGTYTLLRRDADIIRLDLAGATARPESAIAQNWPAIQFYRIGEFDRAAPYMARARALIARSDDPENAFHASWLSLADAHRAWLADAPQQALAVVDAVQTSFKQPDALVIHYRQVVGFYLTLGRLDQAERAAAMAPTAAERNDLLLRVLTSRNDRARIAALLRDAYQTPADVVRVLWLPIPLDLFEPHLRQLQRDRPAFVGDDEQRLVDGRLALGAGGIDKALASLQSAELRRGERGISKLMWISMLVADARLTGHDTAGAISSLEKATQLRSATSYGASTGDLWMLTRVKLADVYRQAGRTADAENIERHLTKLLAVADEDHPLKRRLTHR